MRDHDSIVFVMPFKNSGLDGGASLEHSHSQIMGLPFVPPRMGIELSGSSSFFGRENTCVFCQLLATESEARLRVVAENSDFVAWCPYASRCAFETWIAPRKHAPRFEETGRLSLDRLGELLLRVLRAVENHPRINAYNYLLHSAPFDTCPHDHYHWHIEIVPRIAKVGGFEWGTGVFINSVPPEQAASQLRECLV